MSILAKGQAVSLRRFRAGDLAAFQAYRQDPDVGRWQGWDIMDDNRAKGFLQAVGTGPVMPAGAWDQIAIVDADTDALMGDIGVHLAADESEAELGITLAREHQGRGHAQAVVKLAVGLIFERTKAERIVMITDRRNARSLALIKRSGFAFVETIKAEFQGEPCLEDVFEMTRGRQPS